MVSFWTKKTESGWARLWKLALIVGAVGAGTGLFLWRRNLQGRALVGRGSAELRLKATRPSNGRRHARVRVRAR